MYYADHILLRIMQQDGHTIGKAHEQGHARLIGQNGIGLEFRRTGEMWGVSDNHFSAMHLPDVKDRVRVTSESAKRAKAVLQHAFGLIANRPTDVEGMPRFWAQPALAREYGVSNARRKSIKAEVSDAVRNTERHDEF